MKKKYIKIILIVVAVIAAYLYLAHAYIYYQIGSAHLPATDDRHVYICGNVATSSKKIVYASMGDSLTSGVGTNKYEESYPYLLSQYLANDDTIIVNENFSYPGARTENVINDLLAPAIASQPDVVTLLIGVNDIHGFVGIEQFKKNYDFILKELTTKTKAKIYLISIPYIGCHTLILPPYSNYFDSETAKFNGVIQNLAKTYNLQYIDLSSPTEEILKKDTPYYAADLFHPSALGYVSWAKIIYDDINK